MNLNERIEQISKTAYQVGTGQAIDLAIRFLRESDAEKDEVQRKADENESLRTALKLAQEALVRSRKFAEYCRYEFKVSGNLFPSVIDADNEVEVCKKALSEITKYLEDSEVRHE